MSDDEYRKVAARFSVSYMSDAKWVKLFTAVARSGITIERARWTMLENDHTFSQGMPQEYDLRPSRFEDGKFQPFSYKWIRSIFIPREYRPYPDVGYTVRQDVAGVRAAIERVGQFQLEESEDGLSILAYRP
jgi:hypothetical protein